MSLLPVDPQSHLGRSIAFFLYDTPKVLLLLTLVIFAMGVARGAVLAFRAQAARLQAEFEAAEAVEFPADLLASSDAKVVQAIEYQRQLFQSRVTAVRSQVDVLQSRIIQQRATILSTEAQQRSSGMVFRTSVLTSHSVRHTRFPPSSEAFARHASGGSDPIRGEKLFPVHGPAHPGQLQSGIQGAVTKPASSDRHRRLTLSGSVSRRVAARRRAPGAFAADPRADLQHGVHRAPLFACDDRLVLNVTRSVLVRGLTEANVVKSPP